MVEGDLNKKGEGGLNKKGVSVEGWPTSTPSLKHKIGLPQSQVTVEVNLRGVQQVLQKQQSVRLEAKAKKQKATKAFSSEAIEKQMSLRSLRECYEKGCRQRMK
ncbi:hypothetical protein CHS0354_001093 [Potamilus streckersoni]|uniref:Uncharacterized protein n=1 Tax=Potamilus streckersoni TaxID=2493646 RepID=A0AAE0RVQ0_9BIVA|nr:hypothetical protein CHS0354_001093 [Potamilus streckersoni]